jgi:hypothetical protein
MTNTQPTPRFQWDRHTGLVAVAAALLCLVPTAGFVLAWHQLVDLKAFMTWAILPTLALLGMCELYLVSKSPLLFNRLTSGLVGGVAATFALDAVRLPASYLMKGLPDHVPMIGQFYLGEAAGIAPSWQAMVLGYGYHYLLVGALLGAAYALVVGTGRLNFAVALGVVAGLAFVALPQFQLLTVATGFVLPTAAVLTAVAAIAAGAVLGTVVKRMGTTRANALRVAFLRARPVEVATP